MYVLARIYVIILYDQSPCLSLEDETWTGALFYFPFFGVAHPVYYLRTFPFSFFPPVIIQYI